MDEPVVNIDLHKNTVVKANDLIQKTRFELSMKQMRVVLYLISQISTSDDKFQTYEFSIADFCRTCGISCKSGKNYEDLKKAIKDIADKSLWITLDNGTETLLRWIEKPYIDKHSGIIRIRLDADMKPYLLQLKQDFTMYDLAWTLKFKSKYALRLYELIKSVHYHESTVFEKTYSLEELKKSLGAEEYTTYQHFKERVLDKAIKEINEFSDKHVEYKTAKKGHSVACIRLVISTKDAFERAILEDKLAKEFGIAPKYQPPV